MIVEVCALRRAAIATRTIVEYDSFVLIVASCLSPISLSPLSPLSLLSLFSLSLSLSPLSFSLFLCRVQQYVELRRSDAEQAKEGRSVLTPRQLLSILRMAQVRICFITCALAAAVVIAHVVCVVQALARLHFMKEVTEDHVREAVRLVEASKVRQRAATCRRRVAPLPSYAVHVSRTTGVDCHGEGDSSRRRRHVTGVRGHQVAVHSVAVAIAQVRSLSVVSGRRGCVTVCLCVHLSLALSHFLIFSCLPCVSCVSCVSAVVCVCRAVQDERGAGGGDAEGLQPRAAERVYRHVRGHQRVDGEPVAHQVDASVGSGRSAQEEQEVVASCVLWMHSGLSYR
jgi:hypothetical protein